jgi:transposase
MISDEQRAEIRRLFFAEHWKVGTIAAQLGLHHETVKHAIGVDRFANGGGLIRPSMLDPYKELIEQTLAQYPKLRATRMADMLKPRGFTGSVVQVRRFLAAHRPVAAEAYLRLKTLPGEQGQVDWASFGRVRVGNAVRPLSCFVMVLSWSRAVFAQFVLDQQMENFLRCHTAAFQFFGGVPRALLYDNLKSAVLGRTGQTVQFHPRLLELAGHYHFSPKPCAPYRGNEKGKVERQIQYVRHSFFAARTFASVEDLNRQLARWIAETAHARKVPGDDSLVVRDALGQERPLLLPLPEHPFDCDLVRIVHSGKTPYVRFDGNDYSIPHTLIRKPLTLVASNETVRLLDGEKEVARHSRTFGRQQLVEDESHIAELARHKRAAAELRGRDRLRSACPNTEAFLEALVVQGFHLGGQTTRLLKLLDRFGKDALDAALGEALSLGAIRAESVAHLLDRARQEQGSLPPIDPILPDDPRVHDARVTPHSLSDYDALLRREKKP